MNQITLGAFAQGFIENGLDVLFGKLLWFKTEEHCNTLTAQPVYLFVYPVPNDDQRQNDADQPGGREQNAGIFF